MANSETLIDTPFVLLQYHPRTKTVHHEIRQYLHGEAFRNLLERGYQVLGQMNMKRWIDVYAVMLAVVLCGCGHHGDDVDDIGAQVDAAAVDLAAHDAYGLPDAADAASSTHLYVYGAVPGLAPSNQYALRIRAVGTSDWIDAFAFITSSDATGVNAYWPNLANWTNTYVNFETDGPTEIEISRVSNQPIQKAAAHPARKAQSVTVSDGKAYVVINGPSQIAVDIDGQMDDEDTGLQPDGGTYSGAPIHTVTVFANPLLDPRPSPTDPGVLAVTPGTTPPSTGAWTTLYFLPGVHDIGLGFPVHAGKSYYIPGDAIVYGTLNGEAAGDGHDIHITGYGTLSGAHLTHPSYVTPTPTDPAEYGAVHIQTDALDTSLEGITIADSAYHAVIVNAGYSATQPTNFLWLKILGWRKNGDGINPFANGRIENCFIRTQDDASYVNGRGTSSVVLWNDANGSDFVLSALPNTPVTVDDVDVIYARAVYNKWSGGRIFNMRGEGSGAAGMGVTFSNVRLEDTRPTLQAFFIAMTDDPPYLTGTERGAGALSGVVWKDITLASSSVVGEQDTLWGSATAPIQNLTFDNVTIAGTLVDSASHFVTNSYVSGLVFDDAP